MKLGITFWTSSGNTEALAKRARDYAESKGVEVYCDNVETFDRDKFFACDVLAFGSPAQGTEELAPDIQDLMDSITDEVKGKKVIMFGSYGWGGGEYMEAWKDMLEEKGAIIATEPVTCLEAPDNEAFEAIDRAVETLIS